MPGEKQLEKELAACLQILELDGTIEDCLRLHPQIAEELRAYDVLRDFRDRELVQFDDASRAEIRRRLIAAIGRTSVQRPGGRSSSRRIVLVLAGLLSLGVGVSVASGAVSVPEPVEDIFDKLVSIVPPEVELPGGQRLRWRPANSPRSPGMESGDQLPPAGETTGSNVDGAKPPEIGPPAGGSSGGSSPRLPPVALPPIEERPPAAEPAPIDSPPGQEKDPPGQDKTPPGQEKDPPGQDKTPPGQEKDAPGQDKTPPGQEKDPAGQSQTRPGQDKDPSGQSQAPLGQDKDPPGQSKP